MDDKPTKPGSDSLQRDDDLIAAARQQAEAWTPQGSETETTPAADGQDVPVRFRDLPADSFPGFEIVKEVHRGGQGVVYQAVQKATKRRVAIKVMHEGPFAGPRDRARFEREVQILAALKHPNIVAIHDSGTAAGHFFYVMDYISGLPLDQYMASGERSIEETLKLFAKICEAVNAAHLKGVIHRDLKPGNIRIDSKGEPHVLDFGLAKVAMGDMTNDSRPAVMSMTGQFIGSLPWASPEQAEAVPDKIDIRTDVYSLGVILYQMLTGKFPYEVVGNMRDVLDRILKAEPTRPSTIRRQINDEVETIVLKCLAKERERRYQSAGELARDVGRYLIGEPIEAKRDSVMYVLRKQLRRYKLPAAVAAMFVILLSASTVALAVMYRNQSRERQRAQEQTRIAQTERDRADAERDRAEEQGRKLQEASGWLLVERQRADAERDAALSAKSESDAARAAEREQRLLAEQKTTEAEYHSFLANITAADTALEHGDIMRLRRNLEAIPPPRRKWEWHYLNTFRQTNLATLGDRGGAVITAAFSPDGSRIITASRDKTATVWDSAAGEELVTFRGHSDAVTSAGFSPDGLRVVTASRDGTAKLWDAATGQELITFHAPGGPLMSAAFSPDAALVVTSSITVVLWNSTTGQEVATLRGHTDAVMSATFSPDGERILTASLDRTARLWDAATKESVIILGGHSGPVATAAFSPDGKRVVTASEDRTAKVWDATTGHELATLRGHDGVVWCAAFSSDGNRVVTGSADSTAKLWDAATAQELVTLHGHGDAVWSAAFNHDGTRVVTGSWDETAKLWSTTRNQGLTRLCGHSGSINSAAFNPDGSRIVTASNDKTAKLWNAATGEELCILRGHPEPVVSAIFSPDGTRVVTTSDTSKLWDAATGQELATLAGHTNAIWSAAFSPDGKRLVTASEDRTARLWDTATGRELATFRGHAGLSSANFTPDGARIIAASPEGRAQLWDADTGQELTLPGKGERYVTMPTFSPEGTVLISVNRPISSASELVTAGITKMWNPCTDQTLATLDGKNRVNLAAFSPDGKLLLTTSVTMELRDAVAGARSESSGVWLGRSVIFGEGGTHISHFVNYQSTKLWDAATGRELLTLRGHSGSLNSIGFSPDSSRILTASDDQTAKLWDSATGQELVTVRGHENAVRSAVFSPDGTRILTVDGSDTAQVWQSVPLHVRYSQRQAEERRANTVRPSVNSLLGQFED